MQGVDLWHQIPQENQQSRPPQTQSKNTMIHNYTQKPIITQSKNLYLCKVRIYIIIQIKNV